jgi:DNA invertase Pin-like site-specific DNA recombinase
MGEMYYSLIAIFSNFEVARNHERTMAGLAAAKRKGVSAAKPKLSPQDIKEINALVNRQITVKRSPERFNVSRPTIYRHITPTTALINRRQTVAKERESDR